MLEAAIIIAPFLLVVVAGVVGIVVLTPPDRPAPQPVPAVETWSCMVCGAERQDLEISVAYRPVVGLEDMFPAARWQVRYCNDRDECRAAATAPGTWA